MIYLKNVIEEYPECLENSEKLKMHLNYLYPSEKAKTNIIVTIFDSGIANKIKNLSTINEKTILLFCDKLENEYGYSRELLKECLNIWVSTYNKDNDQDQTNISFETSDLSNDTRQQTTMEEYHANTSEAKNIDSKIPICDINDFKIENGILREYIGNSSNVVIPNSVTSIGECAFYKCYNLISVEIPNSVTSIGCNAFYGCKKLANINIPNGISKINIGTFRYCEGLKSIDIPKGITSIGEYAFASCTNLTNIIIPDSVTSIGARAFKYCENLTNITIPNSVTNIQYAAFLGCENLTNLIIPNSVISIGNDVFNRCKNLVNITLPNSISVIEIGTFAFCESLTNINIPNGVSLIFDKAFYKCKNLEKIVVEAGNANFHSENNCLIATKSKTLILGCKNSIIPSDGSVTRIGNNAFDGCENLTDIIIPDSITIIGEYAFGGCKNVTNITIPNSITSIENGAFQECENLSNITILSNSIKMGTYLFKDCGDFTIHTIPKSDVEQYAKEYNYNFDYIDGFKEFDISDNILKKYRGNGKEVIVPDTVVKIDKYAFNDCENLISIILPQSVTSIETAAFQNCENFEKIIVQDGNTVFHSENNCLIETETKTLILGCKNSIIPSDGSVTSIGDEAFASCKNLTNIVIPDSVTSIGEYAFSCCENLTNVTIADSVMSIGAGVFNLCENIKSINIPNGVTSIGDRAFACCENLIAINIPNSVTNIGDEAFYFCSNLINIVIPDSVTSIGDHAFESCYNLTSITIPSSVTSIGCDVLESCEDITIYTTSDSLAEEYAEDEGIDYVIISSSQKDKVANITDSIIKNDKMVVEDNATTITTNIQKEQIKENISNGVCRYCGGTFKGLFHKKCSNCGKKKDY